MESLKKFEMVPASMLLDKNVISAINFHCGDDDGDDGQFGKYSDGLLWIGTVTDDDGKEIHGLHLATAEYPEEGSTTLVEFEAPAIDLAEVERLTAERDALQSELTKARELLIPEECPHMIVFDDADREPLMFAGAGARNAALKTWSQISGAWNAHLFVRVERNCRDDRYPSAHQSAPAAKDGDRRQETFIRLNSDPHCPECGHPDCNGHCYGDDMMGDS